MSSFKKALTSFISFSFCLNWMLYYTNVFANDVGIDVTDHSRRSSGSDLSLIIEIYL